MSNGVVRNTVVAMSSVFLALLLVAEVRSFLLKKPPSPAPPSSSSPSPAPTESDAHQMDSVVDLSDVSGRWVGLPGEWADIASRKAGSPYPWSIRLQLAGPKEPLECGFFSTQYLNDPHEPKSGYWRVSYCSGADLPDGGSRYAMRLVLMIEKGPVERLHVLVGSSYELVLHRSYEEAGSDR